MSSKDGFILRSHTEWQITYEELLDFISSRELSVTEWLGLLEFVKRRLIDESIAHNREGGFDE